MSGLGGGLESELAALRASPSTFTPRYSSSYSAYPPAGLPPTSSAYRRTSTIDLPITRQASYELPPDTSSLRRSSTLDRERAGSVARGADSRAISPNYSRYSSTLEDTGDWGFSTLRRRASRPGATPRAHLPNDDIQF